MKEVKIYLLTIMIILLSNCEKDQNQLELKFQEMVDNLDLYCPEETSDDFFKAEINGIYVCYYDGVNGLEKKILFLNTYTTSGSSFSTDSEYQDFGHSIFLGILRDSAIQYQNWFEFRSPKFNPSISKEAYLDSIFSIPYHEVISDQNKQEGLEVRLNMMDKIGNMSKNGGNVYSFYSGTGKQDSSCYIYFKKAEKILDHGRIFYDIEMEVNCNLYYLINSSGYAQYGKEGLWGELRNGLLKMKVEI